jgi:hypothetical protein
MVLEVKCGGGTITSDLKEGEAIGEDGDKEYLAAVDAIESIVLAHAAAGIDVKTLSYIQGIETAVQKITEKFL